MGVSMLVAVGVAILGALLALLFLPARATARTDAEGKGAGSERGEASTAELEATGVPR
jgi:hypothetical protein